ncbi:hypothetical protein [Streptomyces sp. NBC_01497]|uniref:hypothetical protein n=1 Tax=Streptomyces sp. NBC_01497 TaxID=2903885 RepID=UPI002E325F4B|nr:hypothetical protein [Streptomyces sp. NBC_01497]
MFVTTALAYASLALLAGGPVGQDRPAASPSASPAASFAACPPRSALPAGADPAAWRCEVMSATGHLTLGRIDVPIAAPMTVTHAEGTVDGHHEQVWGGLSATPIRVGRSPFTLTARYAGHFDFLSDATRVGELDLTFTLSGPGLPSGCRAGDDADPVHLVFQPASPDSTTAIEDVTFAAPGTHGCGVLGPLLDRAAALPSPPGRNSIVLNGERSARSYADPAA